ncbi:hypothetical protein RJ55_08188 [Drechmeria coniospora]|nr:hypothetical protein RJ55_08188 [Drechmeria coniospora]
MSPRPPPPETFVNPLPPPPPSSSWASSPLLLLRSVVPTLPSLPTFFFILGFLLGLIVALNLHREFFSQSPGEGNDDEIHHHQLGAPKIPHPSHCQHHHRHHLTLNRPCQHIAKTHRKRPLYDIAGGLLHLAPGLPRPRPAICVHCLVARVAEDASQPPSLSYGYMDDENLVVEVPLSGRK